MAPFDNPDVRQAIALAIDRQRLDRQLLPARLGGGDAVPAAGDPRLRGGLRRLHRTTEKAKQLLAEAGYPDGLDVDAQLPRRGPRLPAPSRPVVATDIQAQLAEIGINVTLDLQESTTFIDNTDAGTLPFFLLGWGADFPDPTNFIDYHFGRGVHGSSAPAFPDIHDVLRQAGQTTDQDGPRRPVRPGQRRCSQQHIPMVPIAYGGSAMAYKADVVGAHASPLTSERLSVMQARAARTSSCSSRTASPAGCTAPTRPTARRCGSASRSSSRCCLQDRRHRVRAGARRELGVQRRPDGVDVPPPRRRDVPRRLGVRRHRRGRELPRPVGRRRPAPRRP